MNLFAVVVVPNPINLNTIFCAHTAVPVHFLAPSDERKRS